MTASLIVPVLAASLVGSLHCAGMCGGLVAFYSGTDVHSARRRVLGHVAYNVTRLGAYLALGGLAGALGVALDLAGTAAGLGRVAALLAGSLMALWGLSLLLQTAGAIRFKLRLPESISRRASTVIARVHAHPPVVRASLLGLASALLPCGWLYAFVVTASGTGSIAGGVAVMGAFWLGTLPMLVGLGVGVQRLSARIRRHVPVVTALALLVVGLSSVFGRVNVPALAVQAASRAVRDHGPLPQEHCGNPPAASVPGHAH